MTHVERLQAMYRHMPTLGLGRWSFAPPRYRLLWRLGFQVAPPHFTPFGQLVLLQGGYFGLAMGLAMALMDAFFVELPWGFGGLVLAAAIAGAFFGVFMAIVFRAQARKRQLPLWRDYHGN